MTRRSQRAEAALDKAPAAPPDGGRGAHAAAQPADGAGASCRDANLALISTPGEYAAAEAMKALRLGLNVMLFSDNVALARRDRAQALRARAATCW